MKKQLWENEVVVNEDDLIPMVYTVGWRHFLIGGIDVESVNTDELTKGFKAFREFEEIETIEHLEDSLKIFLVSVGYEEIELTLTDDYEKSQRLLAFDINDYDFYDFSLMETINVYTTCDSNGNKAFYEETESITYLDVSNEGINVNDAHFVLSMIDHGYDLYHIRKLNNEPVHNTFLLEGTPTWEDFPNKGTIITLQEIKEHFDNIQLDPSPLLEELNYLIATKS